MYIVYYVSLIRCWKADLCEPSLSVMAVCQPPQAPGACLRERSAVCAGQVRGKSLVCLAMCHAAMISQYTLDTGHTPPRTL